MNRKRVFGRRPAAATIPWILLLACDGGGVEDAGPSALDLPRWEISSAPLLSIGVADGDSSYQFFQASSGLRLEDGTIVVANTGTSELKFYDSGGQFLRAVGRQGEGPGEFRGLTSVYSLNSDTLTTFDRAMRRSYFDADGRLLGSVNLDMPGETEYPALVWLYRGHWVDGVPPGEDRIRFARYLNRLPPALEDPAYWYVRVDLAENLWVSDGMEPDGTRRHWTVYDSTGTALARASLPARFEMLEIGASSVLGRWRDELDIEFVQILGLEKSADGRARSPVRRAPDTLVLGPEAMEEIVAEMRSVLRNTVMVQEMHWAGNQRYALHANELERELPEGIWFDFIQATPRSYVAVAGHRDSPRICGIAVNTVPSGWAEGMVKCSQLEPG